MIIPSVRGGGSARGGNSSGATEEKNKLFQASPAAFLKQQARVIASHRIASHPCTSSKPTIRILTHARQLMMMMRRDTNTVAALRDVECWITFIQRPPASHWLTRRCNETVVRKDYITMVSQSTRDMLLLLLLLLLLLCRQTDCNRPLSVM